MGHSAMGHRSMGVGSCVKSHHMGGVICSWVTFWGVKYGVTHVIVGSPILRKLANTQSSFFSRNGDEKSTPKISDQSFIRGRQRGMSVPRCLFLKDLEGLTEVCPNGSPEVRHDRNLWIFNIYDSKSFFQGLVHKDMTKPVRQDSPMRRHNLRV